MKVHVVSGSTSCVGVSNPDPSSSWATSSGGRTERTRICRTFEFGSREVQFIWHVEIKKNAQKYLNGQNPESLNERIIFMSVFNDIERTKKGNRKTCLHIAKEVAPFATRFKPGRFLGPASENTWAEGENSRFKRHVEPLPRQETLQGHQP